MYEEYHKLKFNYTGRKKLCPFCMNVHSSIYVHVLSHNKTVDDYGLLYLGLESLPKCECGAELHFDRNKGKFPSTCSVSCARRLAVKVSIQKGSNALIHKNRIDKSYKFPIVGNNLEINQWILENSYRLIEDLPRIPIEDLVGNRDNLDEYIANILFSISESKYRKYKVIYKNIDSELFNKIQLHLDKLNYKSQNYPRICKICGQLYCSKFESHVISHGITTDEYLLKYENISKQYCLICGKELERSIKYGYRHLTCSKSCEIRRRMGFGNSIGNNYLIDLESRGLNLKSTCELVIFLWMIYELHCNIDLIQYENSYNVNGNIRKSDFIFESTHYEIHSKFDFESKSDIIEYLRSKGIKTVLIPTQDIDIYKKSLYKYFDIYKLIKDKTYKNNRLTKAEISRLTIDYPK